VVFLSDRVAGCEAIASVPAAGLRPSALDFLDGATFAILRDSYPGAAPPAAPGAEPGPFALIVEFDGSSPAEVQAQRAALVELLGPVALEIDEPSDASALWRWRDGANGVVTGVRGAKVSQDVVFPLERLGEGIARFASIAAAHGLASCAWGHGGEGNVHATVLVDPSDERELDAADAVADELFSLVVELGGSVAGEHGVGWLKRGRLAAQWDSRAVALHEAVKRAFDPKGLMNPGKKLAR
jgi:D-lactate dehydrogenase